MCKLSLTLVTHKRHCFRYPQVLEYRSHIQLRNSTFINTTYRLHYRYGVRRLKTPVYLNLLKKTWNNSHTILEQQSWLRIKMLVNQLWNPHKTRSWIQTKHEFIYNYRSREVRKPQVVLDVSRNRSFYIEGNKRISSNSTSKIKNVPPLIGTS